VSDKVHTHNLYGARHAGGCRACIDDYGPYQPSPGGPDHAPSDAIDEAGRASFEGSPFRTDLRGWDDLASEDRRPWIELGLRDYLMKERPKLSTFRRLVRRWARR
jgi:hypothetical protein